MHSQHRRGFFITGVLFLLVFAMTLAGRGLAEAAVISVTPANVKAAADRANANKAAGAADIDDIQDILVAAATYVGDEDILNFAPGEYKDAGELLITRAITIRKDPDADGKVMFTGKVLINIKADDVIVEGLEFMNVTVPDAVTMTVDREPNTDGDQTVTYGFPGKTIKQALTDEGFTGLDAAELTRTSYLSGKLTGTGTDYDWLDQKFVTVAASTTPDNDDDTGKIANRVSSIPIAGERSGQTASTAYAIHNSVVADLVKGVLGVIWVDSTVAVGADCKMSTAATPAELPQIKGVIVRNNMFNGTEVAGVRAGSMKSLIRDVASICRVQLDIIGNTFSNIGGTGGFVKVRNEGTNLPDVTDADGNKIAEPGNVAPAISVTSPAGTSDAKTRILSNTITGGLGDGIELRWTPEGQKVDIKNNLLEDTPLDGITVIGSGFATTDTTTDISITGNKIIGTSNNRYLTINQALNRVTNPVFYGRHFIIPNTAGEWNNGPNVYTLSNSGNNSNGYCVGAAAVVAAAAISAANGNEARRALLERVKVEVWRSPVPPTYGYAVKFDRGETFIPAYASDIGDVLITGTGSRYREAGTTANAVIGRSAVLRIAADRCFDLARIKVYNQAGVSITGNDLGYNPPDTPDKRFDVIDYGIVIAGAEAMKLKALSGNNIDFASVNSIKNGGASLSVAGNYFGPREPQFGGTVTGRDDASESPLETMAGPMDADINPDTAAPGLTTSGDDAPTVDGTTLTLTFDENLDGESVPAESAFSVVAASSTRTGSRTIYTVADVGVSGMEVTLTLGETVAPGTTGITVTYTKPASNALADASGNEVAGFSNVVRASAPDTMMPGGGGSQSGGGGDDGGCALASAGSAGAGMSIMLLPLMLAGLAFVFRRRAIVD